MTERMLTVKLTRAGEHPPSPRQRKEEKLSMRRLRVWLKRVQGGSPR